MNKVIYVVSRTERGEAGDYDFSVEVFSRQNDAEGWIRAQISDLVTSYKLTDVDVDGDFVMLNGWNHTVQYNVEEKAIH